MKISLRVKFNLVLLLICTAGFFYAQYYMKTLLMRQARTEVSQIAQISMAVALAVRKYSSEQVKPFLDRHQTLEFTPVGVPAFAAIDTMRLFNENYPGHTYREVALNPMNPENLPLGWEKELLERYRSGEIQGEFEHLLEQPEGALLQLARPLKIKDKSCLACHGKPADAPPALLAQYGDKHGFGWQLGEIIGMQIFTIPAETPMIKADNMYQAFLSLLLGAFVLFFAALNIALYRFVIAPMNKCNLQLEKIASEDLLTGTSTRRRFMELLQQELDACKVQEQPFSLIAFDIDHFKRINDNFGHGAGDEVLRCICQLVMQITKRRDHLGRIGGEEFMLLLPQTTLNGAMALAQNLCDSLGKLTHKDIGQVTASFGVVQYQTDESITSLLHRADTSMYRAKKYGRNQVDTACNKMS